MGPIGHAVSMVLYLWLVLKRCPSSTTTVALTFQGSTIGPIPYAIAADVGATRLRIKTISLGRGAGYVLTIINTVR